MTASTSATSAHPRSLSRRRQSRCATVTLETILTMPIWLLVLLAVVEFGLILVNQQQVALASRLGAEEASQTANLLAESGGVPLRVVEVIEHHLSASGIHACEVMLEHNVRAGSRTPGPTVVLSTDAGHPSPLEPPLPSLRPSVQVTVSVPITELAPNLLRIVGLEFSASRLHQSTTRRYER